MESNLRIELLEDEKKRRDEVIAAAEKHRKGGGDRLREQYETGRLATYCARLALADKVLGKYPLLSADYQHWLEDEQAWLAVFKTRDGFEWPAPKKMGAPYSRAFLEAFYQETEADRERRRQEQARYAAAPRGPIRTMANADDDVETPQTWNHDGVLVPVEHSSIDNSVDVWKKLFGANVWLKGCVPFEVPVPKHMDPQAVLAAPEDLPELMSRLWGRFSPAPQWCVRFFTRCRPDPSARQDLGNYHKLLRGEQVHFLAEIDSQSKWEFQQHQKLFDNIRIRLDAIARRNEGADNIEGNKTAVRALQRKQQVTISSVALNNVEVRIKSTTDPNKQLEPLVQVIEDGVRPLPLSLDDRRLAVAGAAKTVLAAVVRATLGAADNTRLKIRNKKVLPIGSRFQVIRNTIRQHTSDVKDRYIVDECLKVWSSVKNIYQTYLDIIETFL
ncbi:hypothetical protein F5B21DRAFT_514870 [Xylaria acuta]|nr:hypothetical protein F5B21DRAFT_514870 [Xylaria acuta]